MATIRSMFCSAAVVSMIAVSQAATAVTNAITTSVTALWRFARDAVYEAALHAAALAPKVAKVALVPQRLLRAADAMIERQMRRDRPRIESNFRMCPSV